MGILGRVWYEGGGTKISYSVVLTASQESNSDDFSELDGTGTVQLALSAGSIAPDSVVVNIPPQPDRDNLAELVVSDPLFLQANMLVRPNPSLGRSVINQSAEIVGAKAFTLEYTFTFDVTNRPFNLATFNAFVFLTETTSQGVVVRSVNQFVPGFVLGLGDLAPPDRQVVRTGSITVDWSMPPTP